MNYDLIRNFVTVAKTQNITRTAEILFVSQSTVSHRLQLLEEELCHPLIYRGRGKRVASLTEHGTAFLPIAEKWLHLWQETELFRKESPRQHLRIGCVGSMSACLLSKFFINFSSHHPNIHLSVQVLSSEEIYSQMNEGRLDVGIVLSRLPLHSLQIRPLLSEKMYCICSGNLLQGKKQIDTTKLDTRKEILLNWGVEFMLWHDFRFPSIHEPRFQVNEISLVSEGLQQANRWSIVPDTVAALFESQGIGRRIRLKNPPPDRISYVLTPAMAEPGTTELICLFQQSLDTYISNLSEELNQNH